MSKKECNDNIKVNFGCSGEAYGGVTNSNLDEIIISGKYNVLKHNRQHLKKIETKLKKCFKTGISHMSTCAIKELINYQPALALQEISKEIDVESLQINGLIERAKDNSIDYWNLGTLAYLVELLEFKRSGD